MNIKRVNPNNVEIVVIQNEDIIIKDVQSALDLMATVRYEAGCQRLGLKKNLKKKIPICGIR
jgi:hypothetical protein